MLERRWWKAPSRLRHSRGFGIHSPFAYDLLMNTLREPSAYYIYDIINTMPTAWRGDLRLLVRLISRLRPESFRATGTIAPTAGRVAVLTDSAIVVDSANPDMLVIGDSAVITPAEAVNCFERGGTVLVFDVQASPSVAQAIVDMHNYGMTFCNGRTLIAVGRRDLPRQHFELYF